MVSAPLGARPPSINTAIILTMQLPAQIFPGRQVREVRPLRRSGQGVAAAAHSTGGTSFRPHRAISATRSLHRRMRRIPLLNWAVANREVLGCGTVQGPDRRNFPNEHSALVVCPTRNRQAGRECATYFRRAVRHSSYLAANKGQSRLVGTLGPLMTYLATRHRAAKGPPSPAKLANSGLKPPVWKVSLF